MRNLTLLALLWVACFGADTGRLKTDVNPKRAGVFVDGKYLGPAGHFGGTRKYDVAAGEHELKLVEPRYEEVTKKVTVTAGKETVVKETLKRLPDPKGPFGLIRTQSADPFAAVYVNDRYMGHVDEFSNPAQKLALPPGTYEVKIVPVNGQDAVKQTVTLEAGKTTIVK